jgi:phytoene dehydrogenase-like protein
MALVSTMKYLQPGEHDAHAVEAELEAVIDTVQPGWRELVVERRYLPSLIVSHWSPLAAMGGLAGRPGPAVPGVDGLFVAGDWVGHEGMLSEAAFASARRAAGLALASVAGVLPMSVVGSR